MESLLKTYHISLINQISHGSYGTVFHGIVKGEKRAVKITKLSSSTFEKNQILKEASLENGICPLLDSFQFPQEDVLALVFPFADEDLSDYLHIRGNILDREKMKHIASWIFKGLNWLHEKGIVHFDLKANNILRFGEKFVLSDFGLSFNEWQGPGHHRGINQNRSPEADNRQYCCAGDIWSTGVLLYELLFPYSLFKKDVTRESKVAIVSHPYFWANIEDSLGGQGRNFFKQCFDVDFSKRLTAQRAITHRYLQNAQWSVEEFDTGEKQKLKEIKKEKKIQKKKNKKYGYCCQCLRNEETLARARFGIKQKSRHNKKYH